MARVPPLHELLGLWRGDESSAGYVHEALAREICRKLKPSTLHDLLIQLYPGEDLTLIAEDAREIAERVFKQWKNTKA